MPDSMQDYLARLNNPQAAALRESACGALADALAAPTGAVLWAFGLADQTASGDRRSDSDGWRDG